MPSRGDEVAVIYPLYFNKNLTRAAGRRVPIATAVDKPNVEQIAKIARLLGFTAKVEKDTTHPSIPFRKDGRVLITKTMPKTQIIEAIAERL